MRKRLTILSIGILLCILSVAQTDSAFYSRSLQNALYSYKKSAGSNDLLYQGSEYSNYSHGINGHPFYNTDDFKKGSLFYNGAFHEEVDMLYDLVNDELVIKYLDTDNPMRLVSEKITHFALTGHHFVRINSGNIAPGFYELVFEQGNSALLVKWQEVLKTQANIEKQPFFLKSELFYVHVNNVYHLIKNKKDLVTAFADQKPEMRKFINKNDISFKHEKARFIQSTLIKYQSLKKG